MEDSLMIFRRWNFSVLMAILAAAPQVQAGDSLGLFNKDAMSSRGMTMPEKAHAFGKTYGEWAAAWSTWWLEFEVGENEHPSSSMGEIDCSLDNNGHVWFLSGTQGGSAERECSVPPGRPLFYPLVNAIFMNVPGDCDREEGCTVQEKQDVLEEAYNDLPCNLYSEIDGVPTGYVRAQSGAFPAEVASDLPPFYPGLADEETVTEGYWALVPPLSVGKHVIEFGGDYCDPETGEPFFEVDVTYHITVTPHGRGRRGR